MILYRYILKNHLVPFLFSSITLMFIFLLQFMMKFSDRLIGKGLDTWVIVQLILYNLAWMVVLVIPMASLVSSLMAFGGMSQNNEVTIMRSSGISLIKMMIAPFFAAIVVGYLLILFNNDVLPDANHKAKILMQDISRKKPTLSLEPGLFSQEVPNYAILVRGLDKNSNKMSGITLYDYSDPMKVNVVTAKTGNIYFSGDQSKLIMDLNHGEIHESNASRTKLYRKLEFDHHKIAMNAEQFSFQQSSPIGQRSDRELSSADMQKIVDSLEIIKKGYVKEHNNLMDKYFLLSNKKLSSTDKALVNKENIKYKLGENLRNARNEVLSSTGKLNYIQSEINKYKVEIHKKYSLPAACIIFVLIGAPLGVMVRKGGFGVAASISLFFFLIYWAFLIGGEKLADRALLSPFWGMWAANFVLGAAGVFLTIKTMKETIVLDFSFLKRLVPKQWREFQAEEDNNETT